MTKRRTVHLFTVAFESRDERNRALDAIEAGFKSQTVFFACFYSSDSPSELIISVSDPKDGMAQEDNSVTTKKQLIEKLLRPLKLRAYSFVKNTNACALNLNENASVAEKQPSTKTSSVDQLPSVVLAACGRVRFAEMSE